MSVTVQRVNLRAIHDIDPDLSYLEQHDVNDPDPETRKYARLDRIRLRAYHRDAWHCVGLAAEADVDVRDDATDYVAGKRDHAGGLWGIESDSGDAYFVEIWAEQWAELVDRLPAGAIGPHTPVYVLSTPDLPEVDR